MPVYKGSVLQRLVQGAEQMAHHEQTEDAGWWEGWAQVRRALWEMGVKTPRLEEDFAAKRQAPRPASTT